jgi:hypothetical protein
LKGFGLRYNRPSGAIIHDATRTCSPKNLKYVEHSQIVETPFGRIEDLSAFNYNRVGRKVDAPSQRGRADKNLLSYQHFVVI